jgi:hypothetical protein
MSTGAVLRVLITMPYIISFNLLCTEAYCANRNFPALHADQPVAAGRRVRSVCVACIRANMNFLASDALQGRGSGTTNELIAATYAASVMQSYGVAPLGDNGSYVQTVVIVHNRAASAPELKFMNNKSGTPAVLGGLATKRGNRVPVLLQNTTSLFDLWW